MFRGKFRNTASVTDGENCCFNRLIKKTMKDVGAADGTFVRPTALGNFLRTSRQHALRGKSMSLVRAATLLGYDKNSIQAYEVGVRLPDVQFLAHAAALYKKSFRTMLGLLLRSQRVRGGDAFKPDPVCIAAADRIEILGHEEILDPESQYASAINFELLADVLQSVERAERKSRSFLQPKYKAKIVSALYGVAINEGPTYDLGVEYLVRVIRGKHKEYLE